MKRHLLIVLGPTASGKTDYAASLARKFHSPIISCDSRQIYREMRIGTAVPPPELLAEIPHYFIQTESVTRMYTAGDYETDAIALLEKLFDQGHETLVMCGGTMFYIEAVCRGLDNFPDADPALRASLMHTWKTEGVEPLVEQLRSLDPATCEVIDLQNGQRVIRALEVCLMTGKPFSSFKTGVVKPRSFTIEKIGLDLPRETLYSRINARTDRMLSEGLVDEVRGLVRYRDLPALQTVGYQEVFPCLDGVYDLEEARRLIARNTRHYAKKQLSWWRRDPSIRWMAL